MKFSTVALGTVLPNYYIGQKPCHIHAKDGYQLGCYDCGYEKISDPIIVDDSYSIIMMYHDGTVYDYMGIEANEECAANLVTSSGVAEIIIPEGMEYNINVIVARKEVELYADCFGL